MANKDINYFGEINNQENDYFEGTIIFDSREVELNLDFGNNEDDSDDWSKTLEHYLSNIHAYKLSIDSAIQADFNNGGMAKEYVDGLLNDLENIDELLSDADFTKSKEEQFLSLLKKRVERITFYPGDEVYAVWDYMIDSESSDEILTVHTDNEGKVVTIYCES